MIISRTPYRISLFGGGTDYPAWYRKYGGKVLSSTIDKYLYISVRNLPPYFDHRLRLVYSVIEECQSCEEIRHPAAREVLKYLGVRDGVEIHYDGDLPGQSGMGSSSAFTVGLLHALSAYLGKEVTPQFLTKQSIHIEQEVIGEAVGSQDQVNAAYGGFNSIGFHKDGSISVQPFVLTPDQMSELNEHLLLFFTRKARFAHEIATSYFNNLDSQKGKLIRMLKMVDEAENILRGEGELNQIGNLLDESWSLKRSFSSAVSSEAIDSVYEAAKSAGALGGKLTGAGGGGMLLLFVPPSRQSSVKDKLNHLLHIPFHFQLGGSQVIFSD